MADLLPKEEEGADKDPLALKLTTSRPFEKTAKSIPGVGEAPEMVEAAFSEKVEPKVYEVRGDFYLMELDERNKPNDEQFKEQRDALREKLLSMKQSRWLVSQVRELREQAEKEGRIQILYQPSAASEATAKESDKKDEKKADDKKDKKPAPSKPKKKASTPKPAESEPSEEEVPDPDEESLP
jgi:hypothetical protein